MSSTANKQIISDKEFASSLQQAMHNVEEQENDALKQAATSKLGQLSGNGVSAQSTGSYTKQRTGSFIGDTRAHEAKNQPVDSADSQRQKLLDELQKLIAEREDITATFNAAVLGRLRVDLAIRNVEMSLTNLDFASKI